MTHNLFGFCKSKALTPQQENPMISHLFMSFMSPSLLLFTLFFSCRRLLMMTDEFVVELGSGLHLEELTFLPCL
jgi:hypothetical protein